jgi:hypothetical protein
MLDVPLLPSEADFIEYWIEPTANRSMQISNERIFGHMIRAYDSGCVINRIKFDSVRQCSARRTPACYKVRLTSKFVRLAVGQRPTYVRPK